MNVTKRVKLICCILASILWFLGFGVVLSTTESSFLFADNISSSTENTIRSDEQVVGETRVCTLSMLHQNMEILRGNTIDSMTRWKNREFLLFLVVGWFLQYLFYYQSEESKEDGQLFLCRSAIVDYIHLKDSGE